MAGQDCSDARLFFEFLLFLTSAVAIGIILLNIMYLDKTIPKFRREHYLIFFRLGAGYGAKQEWTEAGLWGRMLVPWKALGFSDAEANKIVKIELDASIEAMASCIVVALVYVMIFPYAGRALGLCS
jgi:hypothetical protein